MKRLLAFAFAVALCAAAVAPGTGSASQMTCGDTLLAAGGSFKIYPLFIVNGGHIHAPQWVGDGNNFNPARSGFINTELSKVRINVYSGEISASAQRDTSGFSIPAGVGFTAIPDCDSILVVNTGGTATTITWALFR